MTPEMEENRIEPVPFRFAAVDKAAVELLNSFDVFGHGFAGGAARGRWKAAIPCSCSAEQSA
jgi:hypothetical protein